MTYESKLITLHGVFSKPTRVAVVAAHPDDEVISMGGLLAAAHAAGCAIHLVWLTDGRGSASTSATNRPEEARSVVSSLAADSSFLGFKDRHVDYAGAISAVEKELDKVDPEVVVWPFSAGHQHHQDHVALHQAMVNILTRAPYGGCSWLSAQPVVYRDNRFMPNLYHAFDEGVMRNVLDLMGLYRSERNPPLGGKLFSDPVTLQTRRQLWAQEGQTGTLFAEPYQLMKGSPPAGAFEIFRVRFSSSVYGSSTPLDEFRTLESACQALLASSLEQIRLDGDAAVEPTSIPYLGYVRVNGPGKSKAVAFVDSLRPKAYEIIHVALVLGRTAMASATDEASRRLRTGS